MIKMVSLPKLGFLTDGILLAIFFVVALLDLAGIIVDNPFVPGK